MTTTYHCQMAIMALIKVDGRMSQIYKDEFMGVNGLIMEKITPSHRRGACIRILGRLHYYSDSSATLCPYLWCC